ncbi:MAG: hypothetical protein EOP54_15930 [Sphingobacteriales bacterium]|nr:MAG: hypothetical protein EOP54_15930 [Sphingobacteriales bacterium]
MKAKYTIIVINLLLLLGYFNWSIMAKEHTLEKGHLVLLELAPVDPRSLMQGDYMRLNYVINNIPQGVNLDKRGYCIIKPAKNGVAQKVRFQPDVQPLKAGELAIKYFSSGEGFFAGIHIGAESYFFEEGQAKHYEAAKYGGLMVDDAGNSVLTGLYDGNYKLLK